MTMRSAKEPAHVDRVLAAAAFGVIALIVVFGRPLAHSHRSANSVTTDTASAPISPVATDAADREVASGRMLLTTSRVPASRAGHPE
jgi:hypothetical protein